MKKLVLLVTLPLLLSLSSCGGVLDPSGKSNDSNTSQNSNPSDSGTSTTSNTGGDTSTTSEDEPIVESDFIQNHNILHAWDWTISNVISRLQDIKNAGYGTIQLSPLQPQKDYYTGQNWKSQWWKLYQPLGFSVAQSNQNVLGTKSELTSLCQKADALGLKVIVDVVSNHLAGGSGSSLNDAVGNYESVIKNNNLIHTLGKSADDNNLQSIVQGTIGNFPDLKTEDSRVQDRVLSLLKEYIDCGISGFRFDAAKHIETPDDGQYASQYWPTILNGATQYATSKGKDAPYYYGEILTTCGTGRSYSSYTEYMSVIDNRQGEKILTGVTKDNLSYLDATFPTKVSPNKLILWADSHDTYANDDKQTTNVAVEDINKAYMIQASRKDAASLFFVRPESGTTFGDVGTNYWKNSEIKAINLFHNRYIGKAEALNNNNGCFVNIRGSGSNRGAAIINIANASNSVTVNVDGLANGSYIDLVTNKKFTVNNGQVSATFTNNACILVPENSGGDESAPELSISVSNEVYSGSTTVSVNATNATSVTYTINNGSAQTISGNSIALPSSLANGKVVVKVTAKNSNGTTSKSLTLIKSDALVDKDLIITDFDTSYQYKLWTWNGSGSGSWKDLTMEGNIGGYNMGQDDTFIVVKWNKNESNPTWDNKINQTENISKTQRVYSYTELTIK